MSDVDKFFAKQPPIAPESLSDDNYIDAVVEELIDSGYIDTLMDMPSEDRLTELRHYAEMVEYSQQHAWKLAAHLVTQNVTRDKLLHPDYYQAVLYFAKDALVVDDLSSVPYYVQLSISPSESAQAEYDLFRDVIYDNEKPGFCSASELIAAIPGLSIGFRFYEATDIAYSPELHHDPCLIDLDGKIAQPRPELNFVVSNKRPVVSVDVLDQFDDDVDDETYILAIFSVIAELKAKLGLYAQKITILEDMTKRHMLFPDLDFVEGDI